jgi:hypothetical protein
MQSQLRGIGGESGEEGRRARTLALSWAMIFMRSASMLPSFFSDSSTSSGRTTFDDDPITFHLPSPPNHQPLASPRNSQTKGLQSPPGRIRSNRCGARRRSEGMPAATTGTRVCFLSAGEKRGEKVRTRDSHVPPCCTCTC